MNKKKSLSINGIDDELIKQTALTYLAAIFLVLIGYVFVWPRFHDLLIIKSNIKTTQQKALGYQTSLGSLDKFKMMMPDNDQKLLFEAIPLNYDPGLLLSNLRSMSQKLGVGIVDYSLGGGVIAKPKETDGTKGATPTPVASAIKPNALYVNAIKLTVTGSTPALMDFMKVVEQSTPLAQISEVSVSTITRIISTGYPLETVTLAMEVNYYNYPMGVPSGSSIEKNIISDSDIKVLGELKAYQRVSSSIGNADTLKVNGGNKNLFDE